MSDIGRLDRACRDLTRAMMVFLDVLAAELAIIRSTVPPHSHELGPVVSAQFAPPPDSMDVLPESPAPIATAPADTAATVVIDEGPSAAATEELLSVDPSSTQILIPDPEASEPVTQKPREPVRHITTWTKQRLEILERDYQAGVPVDVILERVNDCPALKAVKRVAIGVEAARRGWRRPMPAEQDANPEPAASLDDFLRAGPSITQAAPRPAAPAAPANAVAPAAPQVARPTPEPRWSDERIAAAQPLYENGAPMEDIIRAVNALSGAAVTHIHVGIIAGARGWTRGSREAKSAAGQHQSANYEQIVRWAGERGITVHGRNLPMDEINARRRHLGQVPFVLEPSARGRVL